ncbi:MAG: isoprenoid biosynthesis protein ElbB [Bacteroidia bacterium]|nr:isoprenoid biosynthesis glyoxalase ElbB [Bacteroidales bacterium]NCD42253.1 isoprenoid biosynthesis protein ElbB [Bacteroidia bacterium]MDD2323683.1 isoprenoid biosynthesis glyoxalase ElbB [Bacteroidales bacterium]MDD3011182.1 isoprenoid biosynthesis glyoxalase ElbB [Bacteroidales bacterium]MDD3960599.1 isoprenoid biosynthesis glyoxalase ElbB [Bacteroidales bacterium]
MKKFAVILSGCGVYDGAEIHEAVMTLYAIEKNGGLYQCFAPDIPQAQVVNHFLGEVVAETRNVLAESARIARGKILPLSGFSALEYDAIVFPGGFGAAKNLSNFAFSSGKEFRVIPEVASVILEMIAERKPVAAMCIAPVLLAQVLDKVTVTVGHDEGTALAIEQAGANHVNTTAGNVMKDTKYKVYTTACYMQDKTLVEIAESTDNLIVKMLNDMNNIQ